MRISREYLDPQLPGSFSGQDKFFRALRERNPGIKKKDVVEKLGKIKTYALHKPVKKPKSYRKTLVYKPRDLFQIDLLDYQKHSKKNKGMKYLVVLIVSKISIS